MPAGPVTIVEVGPRDGLQIHPDLIPTAVKVELVRRAVAAGARRIEAASFVHPHRVPQMADAEDVMAAVPRRAGIRYSGLVLNRRGAERAVAAGVDEVNAVIAASDTFGERNQGAGIEAGLAAWHDISRVAQDAGVPATVTVAVAFGCPFTGEVPESRVAEIVRRAATSGPAEIALADTIGVGVPTQVRRLIGLARVAAPTTTLRVHFHDTRHIGYANAIAAVDAGCHVLDAALGGLGGCPFAPGATGNIATEDLAHMLHRMGTPTGIDVQKAAETGTWIADQLGLSAPAALGRAGAFPRAG